LIQAEAVESRTAALADVWLPITPGSEDALALALAGRIAASDAAERTGLSTRQIEQLGAELRDNGPALVIDSRMSANVVALNVQLGGWGKTIGKAARETDAAVPDRSVRVLFIDESLPGEDMPWSEIEKKLVPDNPLVVTFSFTSDGYARHAHYALPVPVFPEASDDLAPSIDSPAPTFRLVTPLIAAAAGTVNPAKFVAKLAGSDASNALRERADSIHKAGRGRLTGESKSLHEMSADDFWKALNTGASWVGEELKSPAPKAEFQDLRPVEAAGLTAVAVERTLTGSPLLSKLYQESNLLLGPGRIAMNSEDARARGIEPGGKALLEMGSESRPMEVTIDAGLRPGILLTAGAQAGPAKVVRI